MDDPKEIDVVQPRRVRASARDPYSTAHSSNSGRRIPHADKVDANDPNRTDILITLHRFELAGVEIDERAVEIAVALTRWHIRTAIERAAVQQQEIRARREEQEKRDCWVYYVRCGSLIKIGMTTNLRSRFASIRPNEVLATEPGGSILEAAMHRRFADARAGGEYFHPSPPLQEHIKDLRRRLGPPVCTSSTVPDGQNWFEIDKPTSSS
jgi:hypothetical protein